MIEEAKVYLDGLGLLLKVYELRKGHGEGARHEQQIEPDPEKLRQVLDDLSAVRTGLTQEGIWKRIEADFVPEEVMQIKADLPGLLAYVTPFRFEDYDFWRMFSRTIGDMRYIARRWELFRKRGLKLRSGRRFLCLDQTSSVLLDPESIRGDAFTSGSGMSLNKLEIIALLTDGEAEMPLSVVINACLTRHSSMGDSWSDSETGSYEIRAGDEPNWFVFEPKNAGYSHFNPFERRIDPEHLRKIIDAVRLDIALYLDEVSKEQGIINQMKQDIADLLKALEPYHEADRLLPTVASEVAEVLPRKG